jgi:hypothetical protein
MTYAVFTRKLWVHQVVIDEDLETKPGLSENNSFQEGRIIAVIGAIISGLLGKSKSMLIIPIISPTM